MMEIAHETGTHAVIRSPHFERLTPLVSRRGFTRVEHQRTADKKLIKKKQIRNMNINQSQYQYWKMWRYGKSECKYEGEAIKGSG